MTSWPSLSSAPISPGSAASVTAPQDQKSFFEPTLVLRTVAARITSCDTMPIWMLG